MQSPAAYTCLLPLQSNVLASTRKPPRFASTATPRFSEADSGTTHWRPVAIKTRSKRRCVPSVSSSTISEPSTEALATALLGGCFFDDDGGVTTSTPSSAKARRTTSRASWRSRGIKPPRPAKTTTEAPRRAEACASSDPMGPPPTTASRVPAAGGFSKMVSFVSYGTSLYSAGTTGLEPVLRTHFQNVTLCESPTRTLCADSNVASPNRVSTPCSSASTSGVSCAYTVSRTRRTYAPTAAPRGGLEDESPDSFSPPKKALARAPRRAEAAWAAAMRALDGTQPFQVQSPPSTGRRSTNKTRAPTSAANAAAVSPAEPAPTTTKS
mmetsp:Transcript_8456/g.26072  ORF Transcript_8456/g.26072 Transcript_8456/m.26072 type:complete len:325 (-) Transcript_8456:82-1056(-)